MRFKKVVYAGLAMIMLLSLTATALAATTKTITYKDTEATAALDTNFNWSVLDSDYAKAWTNKNYGSYPVAVRLECWINENDFMYKYDSDASYAECNYTWSDVYCFQSRHSIDNSAHTTEYTVVSFRHREL